MSSSCCACFGPNGSYFFNSPSKWSMHALPATLYTLFSIEPKPKEVHEMALGPDGSFIVVFSNYQGTMLRYQNIPPALERWLIPYPGHGVSPQRDLHSLQISLGAHGAFFAFDKNGAMWDRLPEKMNAALAARRDAQGLFKPGDYPQSVSLGTNGTYVLTTVGGGGAWDLAGTAPSVDNFLSNSKSLRGICVILSPVQVAVSIVIFSTGYCSGAVPESCQAQYKAYEEDWENTCKAEKEREAAAAAARQQAAEQAAVEQQRRNSAAAVTRVQQERTAAQQAAQRQANIRASVNLGKTLIKGLGVVNQLMNAANGNGGGGAVFIPDTSGFDTTTVIDTSTTTDFWTPIQSAASDPIQ